MDNRPKTTANPVTSPHIFADLVTVYAGSWCDYDIPDQVSNAWRSKPQRSLTDSTQTIQYGELDLVEIEQAWPVNSDMISNPRPYTSSLRINGALRNLVSTVHVIGGGVGSGYIHQMKEAPSKSNTTSAGVTCGGSVKAI